MADRNPAIEEARHREMMALLATIGNTMAESAGVLTEIKDGQDEANDDDEAARKKAAAAAKKASVTEEDGDKKGLFATVVGGVKGAIDAEGGKLKMAKKLGIAAALLPFLDGFLGSMVDDIKDALFPNNDPEGKKDQKSLIERSVGKGGLFALIGGFINKRLIIPGFFMGVFNEIFKDMENNKYLDATGLTPDQQKSLGMALSGALGLAVPRLVTKTVPGLVRNTVQNARGFGNATVANRALQANAATGVAGQAGRTVPTGMRVNSAGRVVNATTGRFTSIAELEKAMKAERRAAKLAKYSKFFKFLKGGALAILPSLFDVAMAIYNDAPEDEVKKELSGVLGAAGGFAIGALGGSALGTAIFPGVGSAIGLFLGGAAGALGGEKLIEAITGSLLSGNDLDADKFVSAGQRRRDQRKRAKNKALGITPDEAMGQLDALAAKSTGTTGTPDIGPDPAAEAGLEAQTEKMTTPSGGFVDSSMKNMIQNALVGGNTNNQTNVGGSSTTFNIVNGSSNSLSNAPHLPVPQGF
jgi:hypothetical protein